MVYFIFPVRKKLTFDFIHMHIYIYRLYSQWPAQLDSYFVLENA